MVAQFRYMRDSKYYARSHIKKMSNTMFVDATCTNEVDRVMSQRAVCVDKKPLLFTRRGKT